MDDSSRPRPNIVFASADIGGTFTDVVLRWSDGVGSLAKVLSTGERLEDAILSAIEDAAASRGLDEVVVEQFAHGSTVATSALLEGTGARIGLVTTAGFADVLELARLRRPSLFDLDFIKAAPLVPRDRRREVVERVDAHGAVLVRPDPNEIAEVARRLAADGVEAVAVCLLNAHVEPANERAVADGLAAAFAEIGHPVPITVSSDIQREIREFERTSTAVINAYVTPKVSGYLRRLALTFEQQHATSVVRIMQSNGSLIPAEIAARFPCRLIESGPAAGVIAAARFMQGLGDGNGIAFDMGGTTAKASLIEAGQPTEALQLEVGGAMNRDGAGMTGAGHLIRVPSLDITEVGAGGGSIVQLDATGAPRIGPESSGSQPGPACYGLGGDRPTVTDADVVLGLLNPVAIAGGRVPLMAERAAEVVLRDIAEPLGLGLAEAAWGIHQLANAGMEQALRAVSIERGRDPAAYTLVAYGGAGPVHAALMAESLGMHRVMVPPRPGLLCAEGLALASVRDDIVFAFPVSAGIDLDQMRQVVAAVRVEAAAAELRLGVDGSQVRWRWSVRHAGQRSELLIDFDPQVDLRDAETLWQAVTTRFAEEHARTYGFSDAHAPVEVVAVRAAVSSQIVVPEVDTYSVVGVRDDDAAIRARAPDADRAAYFGPDHGWVDVRVIAGRDTIGPGEVVDGPAIVEEADVTVVVPPGWTMSRDDADRLLLEHEVASGGVEARPIAAEELGAAVAAERAAGHPDEDPLTVEIVLSGLRSIAHEMAVTVANCAISQVVRDSLDFSTAVFDADGSTVAQGLSIPLHLGAMPAALAEIRSSFGDDVRAGDVFLLNDPDLGGMHLPDIFAFRPVFLDTAEPAGVVGRHAPADAARPADRSSDAVGAGGTRPVLWLGCVAHHADIGGRFPGGNAVDGTHIFEEGLQLPPMRVVRDGVFDENVRRIINRNVRIPEVVWTDLSAQLAALADAEQRSLSLLARFSLPTVWAAIRRDIARTEQHVRRLIGALPDGRSQFTDHIDGDMPELAGDLEVVCTLTIDGETAAFDFTGSSPQVPVAINATESFTRAATLTAFLAVFNAPELRFNDGLYRALHVIVPEASLLAGRRPAPRAARGITGFRTIDAVLGVLAEALPGRVMAAGDGGATMISVGMVEPDGTSRVLVDFLCGAWGGRPTADGLDGASALGANLANVPIEELEANFPVRFVRYGFAPDTGGIGRFRGGLASIREFIFLGDAGVLSIRSDRRLHRPYGLAGGGPGAGSQNWLNPDTEQAELLPTKGTWQVRAGDVIRHVTAGGGGWGPAGQREPAAHAADVRLGKVTG